MFGNFRYFSTDLLLPESVFCFGLQFCFLLLLLLSLFVVPTSFEFHLNLCVCCWIGLVLVKEGSGAVQLGFRVVVLPFFLFFFADPDEHRELR